MEPTSIRHIQVTNKTLYVNSIKTVNLSIIVNWVWVLLQPPVVCNDTGCLVIEITEIQHERDPIVCHEYYICTQIIFSTWGSTT